MQKVAPGVAVAVTRALLLFSLLLLLASQPARGAVLPVERADALYHSYDGGGINISGPAVLVRKSITDSLSASAKYYVDTISSASIDVEVILGASRYEEERVENSFTLDYLQHKTLISLGYTNSKENDFLADTISFSVSQDMFGDLTTVSMGYAYGSNKVGKTGDPSFSAESRFDNFSTSVSQILTKNLIVALAFDVTSDAGFLNNPYRKIRYIDPNDSNNFILDSEVYPKTRTSTALAVRGRYFLPYHAALYAEYRLFQDSWGINSNNFEVGYTQPFAEHWKANLHVRNYSQSSASFYSDLFPYANAQNFMARDKELSTYTNLSFGFGISYEFSGSETGFIDKSSINFKYDMLNIIYKDFRDARQTAYASGSEPLYRLNANVMQLFFSLWF